MIPHIQINKVKFIYISSLIVSFLSSIIIIYNPLPKEYTHLFYIPLIYAICMVVFYKILYLEEYKGLGFWGLLITMLFRYVITPVGITLTQQFYGVGPQPTKEYIDFAILLMIYEMICVFIALTLSRKVYVNNLKNHKNKKITLLKKKGIIYIVIIICFIFMIPHLDKFFGRDLFIINEGYERISIQGSLGGAIMIMSEIFYICVVLLFIRTFKINYEKSKSIIWIILSSVCCLINIVLISNGSRWKMVIWMILSIMVLLKLFGKKVKNISIIIAIGALIAIISMTLYKFRWVIETKGDSVQVIFTMLVAQLQDYFSGVRGVAQAVQMSEVYEHSITSLTLVNDFVGSIPLIGNFINQQDRINVYFNLYNGVYNNGYIIPMVGVGYTYFGFILAPIFTMICTYLIIFLDQLAYKNSELEYKIIFSYASIWCALCMGFNTQIIFGFFVVSFLPIYIVFKINNKIRVAR